jgi:SlyX protein
MDRPSRPPLELIDELEKVCRKLVDRVLDLSEEMAASRIEDAPPPHY